MVLTLRDKLILSAIAALFAVRLLTIHTIQLSPDEAYYWNWGQHPSLAYSDHPPMVAWVMAFFTALGGNSELFVRLGGILPVSYTHLTLPRAESRRGGRKAPSCRPAR